MEDVVFRMRCAIELGQQANNMKKDALLTIIAELKIWEI